MKMSKRKLIYVLLGVLLLLIGCSQAGSKDVITSRNSNTEKGDIIQQLETNHFRFYSKKQDKDCLKDLANALEENYERITNSLKTFLWCVVWVI